MKLFEKGNKFPIKESIDVDELKNAGIEIASYLHVEFPVWHSNVVMGNKKLKDGINKWYLFKDSEIILTITE